MIIREIETLRDYVADAADLSRIWMQYIPDKYSPNELSIRYLGDDVTDETGYHIRLDREYQFVYFGESEFTCLQVASALQKRLNNVKKIRIKDSENFLTLESFSMSQPFKSENSEVYAVIGVLQAEVRQARDLPTYEKMQEINVDFIDD